MTNAEKFEEVFGRVPNHSICPLDDCGTCKYLMCTLCTYQWWNDEFKEANNDNN